MKRLIYLSMATLMALLAVSCDKEGKPVIVSLSGISLTVRDLTLSKGGTEHLEVIFTPANATDKTVTWESSDPSVATVKDGEVFGVATGFADITARAGSFSDKCRVEVVIPVPEGAVDMGFVITRKDGTGRPAQTDESQASMENMETDTW